MKRTMIVILVVVFTIGFMFTANTQDKKLKKSEVPKAVITAFEKAYPNAKVKAYLKETEKGITTFEIESIDGKTHRDLQYAADGTVKEIEEVILPGELPQPISASLKKEFPKSSIISAEKSMQGTVITYNVKIKDGKSKKNVSLDETGKILKKK